MPVPKAKPTTGKDLLKLFKKMDKRTHILMVTTSVPKFKMTSEDGDEFPYKLGLAAGEFLKETIVKGVICFDYETAVNNRRKKEGLKKDFESKPLPWGKRHKDSPVIVNKDRFYLQVQVTESEEQYTYNGRPVEPNEAETLEKFLPPKKSRQGVENEVVIRTYDLDSIRKVKIGDVWYKVEG